MKTLLFGFFLIIGTLVYSQCSFTNLSITPTACINGQYSISGMLSFTNPPATGALVISNNCGGQITFTAPFVSPLNFSLSNISANGNACSVTASFSADPNCSINYTYIAPSPCSSNNCSATMNVIQASDSCNGGIIVYPNGGVGPYTYVWSSGTTANSSTASNLCPGIYTCTIVDANGCSTSVTGSVTIASNPCDSLTAGVVVQPNSLNACDGSISIYPSGGISPYSITLAGNGMTYTGGPMFGNVCPGTYTYQVVDANGCSYSNTATVTTNNNPCAGMFISFSNITNATSPSICDGSASVNVTGGTSPYSYVWNNAVTTPFSNNLCSGTYSVCVADMNGCQVCDTVVIYDSTNVNCGGFTASLNITNATSNSTCNGSITPVTSGGTAPYVYYWSNGSTTATQSNLCSATYTLTVMDANGCSISASGYVGSGGANVGDTIVLNGNISNDSTVIGTISGTWIDNCNFDYNTVTNAYISSYVDLVDSTVVTWTVEFNDGTSTTLNATYLFSPGTTGTYTVMLQLYCGLKSNPQWLVAYDQMFYENTASLNSLEEDKVLIYPNPAQTKINFFGLSESSNYQVVDQFGRIILEKSNEKELNISNFENGIYSVVIQSKSSVKIIRFVKQ
jgi:hypothetical protein